MSDWMEMSERARKLEQKNRRIILTCMVFVFGMGMVTGMFLPMVH